MLKVLICGDVKGRLDLLQARVSKLNSSAHGPFDILFAVGQFTASPTDSSTQPIIQPYTGTAPTSTFPIPLYYFGNPVDGLHEASNLHHLGVSGVKDVKGLKIAFMSGDGGGGVDKIVAEAKGDRVHLLLTSQWPCEQKDVDEGEKKGMAVAKLAYHLGPRYHFSGGKDSFFARAPYRVKQQSGICRFIGLGEVKEGSDKAKKWLHALKLDPSSVADVETADTSHNPFLTLFNPPPPLPTPISTSAPSISADVVNKLLTEDQAQRGAVGKLRWSQGGEDEGYRRSKKRQKKDRYLRMDCWYCVASPSCEKHLIASVNDFSYLSLPKGGINPQHVQLIPIDHEIAFAALSTESVMEVAKYKSALTRFFNDKYNSVPLFFERNILLGKAAQRHCFMEVIPIPIVSAPHLVVSFESEAKKEKLAFDKLEEPVSGNNVDPLFSLQQTLLNTQLDQYFYIEVPGYIPACVCRVENRQGHARFPLQFGRQVACRALGCLDRVDWRDCVVPREKEAEQTEAFKQDFMSYDLA